MPAVSLVICVYKERDLVQRLLEHASGCYDDLVVVHDGSSCGGESLRDQARVPAMDYSLLPAGEDLPSGYRKCSEGVFAELVAKHGGHFYEGPRAYQQEPHWPFAWWTAKHDWVLRLDADEFPSDELARWLKNFRDSKDAHPGISGFTCVWPLWDGKRATTVNWPQGRNFLINRTKVRFFGMVEAVPIPGEKYEPLPLILHHQPKRKSYGIRNILLRKQAFTWRRVIAQSLMGTPADLPTWRWQEAEWPSSWEALRRHPLRQAFFRLLWFPLCQANGLRKTGQPLLLSECINPGLHHFLLGWAVFLRKCRTRFSKTMTCLAAFSKTA